MLGAERRDAVVIGAGPNGLVAANLLADEGWGVEVLEAAEVPGGAVRTAEVTAPGFHSDLFSAFYPLGKASPVLRSLELGDHGLRWVGANRALANPTPGGPTVLLGPTLDATAASLDEFGAGDGDAWRDLYALWEKLGEALLEVLLRPFPPMRGVGRLLWEGGPLGALETARIALASATHLGERRFRGEGGRLLLAGNTLHTDLSPSAATGGIYGWLLSSLGQQIGFPVPEGGAARLTDALVRRLESRGGRVTCGQEVVGIEVRDGQAVAVRTASGDVVPVARAVLADVSAPALYTRLLPADAVPGRVRRGLRRFRFGDATVKVDWALREPIPWRDPRVGEAGTVHLADSCDHLERTAGQLSAGLVPSDPFLLVGQMTTSDPTRSPAGTESAWAYTHVPQAERARGDAGPDELDGRWATPAQRDRFVDRMEARIEAHAPGFRDSIVARHVAFPADLEAADANLVGGSLDGGTAALGQQLVLRPVPGLGRAETPVRGLFLASSSAHPGGGVHGACGANAARAALWHARIGR